MASLTFGIEELGFRNIGHVHRKLSVEGFRMTTRYSAACGGGVYFGEASNHQINEMVQLVKQAFEKAGINTLSPNRKTSMLRDIAGGLKTGVEIFCEKVVNLGGNTWYSPTSEPGLIKYRTSFGKKTINN
jgi:hypothetical protein